MIRRNAHNGTGLEAKRVEILGAVRDAAPGLPDVDASEMAALQTIGEVLAALQEADIRVSLDESNERIQAKIKVGAEEKIPYMLIVGPREAEKREVSVRARGTEDNLGSMPLDEFIRRMAGEVADRGATCARSYFDS